MIRHPLVVVFSALLVLLGSCSGSEDVLEEAGSALHAGRLQEATELVADLEGEAADAFRARLAAAEAHRVEVRAALEAIRARVPRAEEKAVFADLAALSRGEKDPVLKEELGFAKSRIYDDYAASSRTWSRGQQGTTELPEDLVTTKKNDVTGPGAEAHVPDPPTTAVTARPTPDPPAAATDAIGEAAETAPPPRAPRVSPRTVREYEELAREMLHEGDLVEAHSLLREAAARSREAELRALLLAEAGDIEDRLRLRKELADGFRADPAPFAALGVAGIDATAGLEVDGTAVAWREVPLWRWPDLGKAVKLTTRAELGLLAERLERDDDPRVWEELQRLLATDRVEEREVFALVARHRGEVVPPGGYAYHGRDWIPASEAAEKAQDELAQALLRDRGLGGALESTHAQLLETAASVEDAELRTLLIDKARDVEDRLRLRTELADGFFADPAPFLALGMGGVDAQAGIEIDGEGIAWRDVPLVRWIALGKTTDLSTRAELGLLGERLARDDDLRVWQQLRGLLRAGRVEESEIFGLVARHRGESVPKGGYVYDGRDWIAAIQAAAIEKDELAANLVREFARADAEDRDALFDELLDEGFEKELRVAMQARWDDLAKRFQKNASARRLRDLAAMREELDRRRQDALDLIFDEEEYFYPYNPPACPPERAKLYPAVQRRVDELVNAVRDVWKDDSRISLRGGLAEIVEEAGWLVRREDEWGKASILPEDLPYWIFGLDLDLESIGLAEFAWNEEEREDLARSRAIRRRNAAVWESEDVPEEGRAAAVAEIRQVEITNDYRLMLGRCALAWNPLIQGAAWDHSDYMATTGDFGHFEPDPERKGPGERMRRRGYDRGAGENCHAGGGDPMGAHVGWCHSSGHHRNLLGRNHREMASGLVGRYWTQDFGSDESFLEELSEWSD